jgi:hypothetical protein
VTGAILDAQGLCMDNLDASPTSDNTEDVYHCNGTSAQVWTYIPATGALEVQGYCADTKNDTAAVGAGVVIEPCDGRPGQVFRSGANGELYNPRSGLCITDPGASTVMDNPLRMEPCGQAGQEWILPS